MKRSFYLHGSGVVSPARLQNVCTNLSASKTFNSHTVQWIYTILLDEISHQVQCNDGNTKAPVMLISIKFIFEDFNWKLVLNS